MPTEPSATKSVKPLQGLRVLDVAAFLAGPFAATQLAEFGAEVIKVEIPRVGDALRRFGTPTDCGDTLVWLSEARNKKSVTLDLRTPEGADILRQLVAKSDVLIENFQPGTLERWGLGWDNLHAHNPKLVMVRITGYGQTGPYKNRPGFGRIGNAFGGLSFLAGDPDRPPATPGSPTIPDYLAGLYGAYGALMALRAREMTGEGQFIDIGLYEPIFRFLDELPCAYHANGFIRQRMGPAMKNAVPHSHYPTKDGRWVAIACTSDKIFERLAALVGRPEVAGDGEFGTFPRRDKRRDEVDAMVTHWTSGRTRDEVLSDCEAAQVPCGMVAAIDEIFEDPQYAARENIVMFQDDRVGEVAVQNVVPRMSATAGGIEWLGPAVGAHNAEIYGELLGIDEARRQELHEAGVI
ncbi:MAG: CoA transferase [Alphaproteobacteria bacterium]|nr:CoA transferase [Alphaproteobacteria bacterium]